MNYYEKKINKIEELKYFPFSSFKQFQDAVKNGDIKDIGIAMDIARRWVMETTKSTPFQRNSRNLLFLLPFILTLYYLISAFTIPNYWLIPYSLLPIIVAFTGSPIARKVFPLHIIIFGIFILVWAFTGNLSAIYWVPIIIQYLALEYMYKGSTQIIRELLTKDEETLCFFWRWRHMTLYLKNGEAWNQDYMEVGGQTQYYEDMQKEWKEYISIQDKKSNKK